MTVRSLSPSEAILYTLNVNMLVAVSISPPIDRERLDASLSVICDRHPLSKCCIPHNESILHFDESCAAPKVVDKSTCGVPISINRLLDEELQYNFHDREALLRVVIAKDTDDQNWIVFTFHHVIVDAISGLSFAADLLEEYFGFNSGNQSHNFITPQPIEYHLEGLDTETNNNFHSMQVCLDNKSNSKKKFTLTLRDLRSAKSYALKKHRLSSFSSLISSVLLKSIASVTNSDTMYRYLCADTRRLFNQDRQLCCLTVGIPERYCSISTKSAVNLADELQRKTYNVLLNLDKLKDFLQHDFKKEECTLGFSYVDRDATERIEKLDQVRSLKIHGVAFYNKAYTHIFAIAYPFRGDLHVAVHYDERIAPATLKAQVAEVIAKYGSSLLGSETIVCEV